MKLFWNIFLKGLAAMIPLVVTVWAIVWLVQTAEDVLGGPMRTYLPENYYKPGMGVAMGILCVFIVGLLLNMVIARVVFHRFELILNRLPLVKSLYGSVKDLLSFFMDSGKKGQQVVMVTLWPESDAPPVSVTTEDGQTAEIPRRPMKLLGLVTRVDFSDLPTGVGDDSTVAVYLPMSYQLGGFTVIVSRSQIEPVDMSTEDAIRFAITAGMNTQSPALKRGPVSVRDLKPEA